MTNERHDEGDRPRTRGRGPGRRGRRGFGPLGFPLPMPPGAGFGPGGPGSRARRGDVRAAVLALVAEQPMHGYQVIQEITQRSDGLWRPSPGSVYPALQLLEDEGLVRVVAEDGRRVFHLTDDGVAYLAAHPDEVEAPWDAVKRHQAADPLDPRHALKGLWMALSQVLHAGSPDQQARALALLDETRRGLYRILAEEADDAEADATRP